MPSARINSVNEQTACLAMMAEVVNSGQFAGGDAIIRLEKLLEEYYQATSCIATSSGADALKIALAAIGVGAGDEIIIPHNAFAATENAIFSIGAKPVYANIDESFNINPTEIARLATDKTKAVLAVCLYGSIRNMQQISREAECHELRVIIDAAQCFGIPEILRFSDAVALSFNPVKNIGGFGKSGALLTYSTEIAKRARQFSHHGIVEGEIHVKAHGRGFNSRMDNIQASAILAKFGFFEVNALKRAFLAYRYINQLTLLERKGRIILPIERLGNTWHLFPIRVNEAKRDELIRYAKIMNVEFDIHCTPPGHGDAHDYTPLHRDKISFPMSSFIYFSVLHIPLHNHMSLEEQDTVIKVIYDFFK
ncbi:aminotransferase class I/II-fold pyridoxal phosphate-dependent enzyme [Sodalis sp. RH21]|uniref:aminotransferase class I/II-fold pyridoxal phosphate-dependent enzyme n=1 Tax=unclassified Sodalis (in: enterobacteria) TaxID=2636512 RepID=UPI0039B41D1B